MEGLCRAVRIIEGELIESRVEPNLEACYPLLNVFERCLEDVQERLCFCTSRKIRLDIANFASTTDDLEYPEILKKQEENKIVWFPTLKETLLLLSAVFRCLEPVTFNEILEEAVGACIESLLSASLKISSKLHGQLFLVKHLLFLSEQISPFRMNLNVSRKELKFSNTREVFSQFLQQRDKLFTLNKNNALLNLLANGVPTVEESNLDCKGVLENKLRTCCDQLILQAFERVTSSIDPLIAKLEASKKASSTLNESLKKSVTDRVANVPTELQNFADDLVLYLPEPETFGILFQPVKANVFAKLTELQDTLRDFEGEVSEVVNNVNTARAGVADVEPKT